MLYPLKFKPILINASWGGSHLQNKDNQSTKSEHIGEEWDISGVQDYISVVSEGVLAENTLQELVEVYMGDLVGDKIYEKFGIEFPLLIKRLDIHDSMEIQVHPDDKTALDRHNAYGKTKMWYVLDCESDAEVTLGFKNDSSRLEYLQQKDAGRLKTILNNQPVHKGDCFFIPAKTIFSAQGCFLAEIQQTSDITYYIDNELDAELATDVIEFKKREHRVHYQETLNIPNKITECDYFTVNYLKFNKEIEREYINLDSFVIYMCTEGEFNLIYNTNEYIKVSKGETILVPAIFKDLFLIPKKESCILEIFIS